MYYLAINYGSEGWQLNPCDSPELALKSVKEGGSFGNEWKILKELNVTVEDANNRRLHPEQS